MNKAVFGLMMLAAVAAIVPGRAAAQESLNQNQAALYLACTGVAGAGAGSTIATSITPNTLAALLLLNQQIVNEAQTLPAIQGLTFVQLGQVMLNSMKSYEKKQLGCQKKCVQAALNLFVTQNQSSCLAIASGFSP